MGDQYNDAQSTKDAFKHGDYRGQVALKAVGKAAVGVVKTAGKAFLLGARFIGSGVKAIGSKVWGGIKSIFSRW